ncbi:hypothetical protein [Rhodococcus sp. 24CO]|uniref:hypothetical protein n=1 Tax=Rhodococcus sp. 24CO TaxID=3117460 RepID=UPI003D33E5ED
MPSGIMPTPMPSNVDGLDRVVADWEPEDVATFAMWLQRFNSDVEKLAGRPLPRT